MPPVVAGLSFDHVVKTFGGTKALGGVSLHINRGEVLALLGENGAGKSTLIKVLGGIHTPDSGQVLIDSVPYVHKPGKFNVSQKVAFIHQDLGLVEWMSIAENMALAQGYDLNGLFIDWNNVNRRASESLAKVGCDFEPTMRISDLSRTEKSLVAIARALSVECDFLVLDEPTASLPANEVERLFSTLRQLQSKGVGMIYVSHRLDEVFKIAHRVAVLRDGMMVGLRAIDETNPEELVSLIVGKKTRDILRPEVVAGKPMLTLRNFVTGRVGPVNMRISQGEVVGLVGLRGAGHEEIGRALFGVGGYEGEFLLQGERLEVTSPLEAIRHGIGMVAKDRVVESLAPALSIRENAFLNPAAVGRKLLSLMGVSTESQAARQMGQGLGLSPNDPTLAIEALSGGNQQKVVVGRWLATDRRLLIAEDPTAGVDVGAKAEIYSLLFEALKRGMGVLVVSTDFEEIANICHRAIVFSRGKPVSELSGALLSTSELIKAASANEVPVKESIHAVH